MKGCIFVFWLLIVLISYPAVASNKNLVTGIVGGNDPSTAITISEEEIEGFLFRIKDEAKEAMKSFPDKIENLPLPVLFGVSLSDIADTWGEPRPGGRVHTGVDIIAPVGELIVSPTDAVVIKIGYDDLGGNFVLTANPGGEQFYYAHLDGVPEGLYDGFFLNRGDLIGFVGNTGNARGKTPHLHLGIDHMGVPLNPFNRLAHEFSTEDKAIFLERVVIENNIAIGESNGGVRFLQRFLIDSKVGPESNALAHVGATGYFGSLTKSALIEYQNAAEIHLADGKFESGTQASIIAAALKRGSGLNDESFADADIETVRPTNEAPYFLAIKIDRDLKHGEQAEEVLWLQNFLIAADTGENAGFLSRVGTTGYFGELTKNALIEYQKSVGIEPSLGYFGPITRASIRTLGGG